MARGISFLKGMPARVLALMLCYPAFALAQAPDFMEFESGQVRPLAMSADGTRLFAVNTPNNALEIFSVTASGLTLQTRVPVGLEPVAVAVRSATEVWVVNHLSDSVSVVTLSGTPRVTRTVLVGDEPRDIVFAGTNNYAFITTAHRGQQRTNPSIAGVPGAGDPQLTTPGVGRADVWVFNPASLGNTIGGTPVRIVTLFGDTPRALAVSPDRKTVYAAILQSGNQTTTANLEAVCDGFVTFIPCLVLSDRPPLFNNSFPGGLPGPRTNAEGKLAPEVGLVVKFNKSRNRWEDTLGRNWNNAIRFRLPDKDVFAIDADTLAQNAFYTGVGTTLFNMVVNPVTGKVYVTNSEAQNLTRFEGPGVFGGSTVQGNLARDARHGHLRQLGYAAPSEQTHRLQQAGERARLRSDDQESQPVDAPRHGSEQRRRTPLRRRLRFEQGRRLQHRRAREQHVRAAHRERQLHQRDRRRPERRRPR